MAGGGGEQGENPVAINVVPMVDVIFCLCVFFMCSFKFKQLEGKFDSWLPKGKGTGGPSDSMIIEEIRVALYWDPSTQRTIRKMRHNTIIDDNQLESLITEAYADFKRMNKPDTPVIVDSEAAVPWDEVVKILNISKRQQITKFEFALGAAPGAAIPTARPKPDQPK